MEHWDERKHQIVFGFDEGAGGKVSCVKSVSGKRIYIFNLQI